MVTEIPAIDGSRCPQMNELTSPGTDRLAFRCRRVIPLVVSLLAQLALVTSIAVGQPLTTQSADQGAKSDQPSLFDQLKSGGGAGGGPGGIADENFGNTPLSKEFQAKFEQWRLSLKEVLILKLEHKVCLEEEVAGVEKRYADTLLKGNEQLEELKAIAVRDFKEAPFASSAVFDFLTVTVGRDMVNDRFESANEICQMLLDAYQGPETDDFVGMFPTAGSNAFRANDFEHAFEYLSKAREKSLLTTEGEMLIDVAQDLQRLWKEELVLRQAEAEADDLPRVLIETTKGSFVIELFENEFPNTVANFINLVERGFYNGHKFFVVKNLFGIKTGCPIGDGTGTPNYLIRSEFLSGKVRNHFRGSVSMTNFGAANTEGSQFSILLTPQPDMNGSSTVFGRVLTGIDVLSKLKKIEIEPGKEVPPFSPDKIIKAEVVRKRPHAYIPEIIKVPQ